MLAKADSSPIERNSGTPGDIQSGSASASPLGNVLADVSDGDASIAAAEVALRRNDLVVVVTVNVQTSASPGVEVAARLDGAAGALVLADRPVLVESLDAVDARCVVTSALAESIGATVALHGTQVGGIRGGIVGAEVLNDVVLDERVAGPTVNREVTVAVGLVNTVKVNGPAISHISASWLAEAGEYFNHSNTGYCAVPCVAKCTHLAFSPGFQPFPPTRLPPSPQLIS